MTEIERIKVGLYKASEYAKPNQVFDSFESVAKYKDLLANVGERARFIQGHIDSFTLDELREFVEILEQASVLHNPLIRNDETYSKAYDRIMELLSKHDGLIVSRFGSLDVISEPSMTVVTTVGPDMNAQITTSSSFENDTSSTVLEQSSQESVTTSIENVQSRGPHFKSAIPPDWETLLQFPEVPKVDELQPPTSVLDTTSRDVLNEEVPNRKASFYRPPAPGAIPDWEALMNGFDMSDSNSIVDQKNGSNEAILLLERQNLFGRYISKLESLVDDIYLVYIFTSKRLKNESRKTKTVELALDLLHYSSDYLNKIKENLPTLTIEQIDFVEGEFRGVEELLNAIYLVLYTSNDITFYKSKQVLEKYVDKFKKIQGGMKPE